ncbi:MAG: formylglycine-generating enzyme family protein [Gammaproteobacteria bacterium]|nr:formylglycine-generating enzyme family protein [Gammaproteobacteria bacterium]
MRPVAVIALLCAAMAIAGCSFSTKQDARQQSALERQLAGEMVSIPDGTFRMGGLSGTGRDNELPIHNVTVPAFRLGKHEVTFAQWDACVADGGCNGYIPDDGTGIYIEAEYSYDIGGWGRDHRPVINVSWDDAQSFIDWLNSKTGGNYRLPTEAEWEYAARAGTTTEYSWGDDIGNNRANCDGCGSQWDGDRTAPAGSFPANPWGLHDMHGNVEEWVQDCWDNNYKGAPTDGGAQTSGECIPRVIRDMHGNVEEWVQDCWHDSYKSAPTDGGAQTSGECILRVIRGGSWLGDERDLRSAYRYWDFRATRSLYLGFRLAQDE